MPTAPPVITRVLSRERRYATLAWAVLLCTVIVSLWSAYWAWGQRKEAARAQFAARSTMAASSLATYINAYEDTVWAAAGVLEAQSDADRQRFQAFVEKLRVDSQRSGIRGVGFARVVSDAQRDAYLARKRAEYGPDFDIYPAGRRAQYVVIDLIYPETEGLKLLLGKDVAFETERREAMQRAAETGTSSAALRVALSDRARGNENDPGFLLYAPVYAKALPANASSAERQQHLRGFTTAGFGWAQVLRDVLGPGTEKQFDIELRRLDRGIEQPALTRRALRQQYGEGMQPAFIQSYPLRLMGEQWMLSFTSPPTTHAIPGLFLIIMQTWAGIGLGVLLFLQLRGLARRDQRSRGLLDAAADRMPVLVAYLNQNRRYGFANRATAEWFDTATTWAGQNMEQAHANDPALLATLNQAIDSTSPRAAVWETEIGTPPRAVQMHLVPDLLPDQSVAGWYLLANDTSEQMRTRSDLILARDNLQRITDKLPAYVAQFDRNERVVFCNEACLSSGLWKIPCEVGVSLRELLTEDEYIDLKRHADTALTGREVEFETLLHRGQPNQRRLHTFYTPTTDKDGLVDGFLAMKTDVTEYNRLRAELFDARERAEVALTSINEAVITSDVAGRITYMNPAAESISGWSLQSANHRQLDEVVPVANIASNNEADAELVPGDMELLRPDGRRILVESSRSQLHNLEKAPIGHVMVLRDVTESRALSSRMAYLAHHDPLTGLPNRLRLNEMLGQIISSASRRGNALGVMFIDLDLFKHVNDGLGHHVGDQLLQQVARRLQRSVGDAGSVYRTGGDEFVVLMHNVIVRGDVEDIAGRLLEIGTTPYQVDSHELHQAFSIGISLFPDDGYDATTLMMRADAAMYLAKRNGRNASRFYNQELAASVDARLELENSLRRGLRDGELMLYYQPRVDLQSGRIAGVEALLRWQRGDRVATPGEFLSVAEETNLIVEIDQWALRTACKQNRAWQQAGLPPLRISVNVAAANFETDRLLATVAQALQESGLAAEYLELEITETTLIRDTQRTERILSALKALRVSIAIDDFGTGFSNLSYLANFGFNVLKIDRSFAASVTEQSKQSAITRAIIGMAGQLHCRTVAEGVETIEQARWLASNGCDELQGYLFSQPLPASEFEHMLASQPSWPIAIDMLQGSPPQPTHKA